MKKDLTTLKNKLLTAYDQDLDVERSIQDNLQKKQPRTRPRKRSHWRPGFSYNPKDSNDYTLIPLILHDENRLNADGYCLHIGAIILDHATGEFFAFIDEEDCSVEGARCNVFAELLSTLESLPQKGKTYGARMYYWNAWLDEESQENQENQENQESQAFAPLLITTYGAWQE